MSHTWHSWRGLACCSRCGIVQRADGLHRADCPGDVLALALRPRPLAVGDRVRHPKDAVDKVAHLMTSARVAEAMACVGTLERLYPGGHGFVRWDYGGGAGCDASLMARAT